MEFTEIKTQEELDKIIGERLARERETSAKKYEGYLSPEDAAKKYEGYISPDDASKLRAEYDKQIENLNATIKEANDKITAEGENLAAKNKEIADRDTKIKQYEAAALRAKVAHEAGLPYGLSERLRGDKEEDIRKDAQELSRIMGRRYTAPLGSNEPVDADSSNKRAAYRKMLEGINNQH